MWGALSDLCVVEPPAAGQPRQPVQAALAVDVVAEAELALRWFVNRDARLAGEVARILGSVLSKRLQGRSGAPQGAAPAQLHAIQRFGSSVNLHIHDHAVVSDGAFAVEGVVLRFYPAPAPSAEEHQT